MAMSRLLKAKNLLKDKKGVIYLFLSSLFIIVMILVFLAYKQYSYTDREKVVETRIMTINDFIKDIEFDSKRVIFISGFRSLIALEDYVATTGNYLNDNNTPDIFRMAFYNGTINGTAIDVLVNSSYKDYLSELQRIAARIGISVDINVTNVTLNQSSPWNVDVYVTTFVNITDNRGFAKWSFSKTYYTSVSLISIRDPIYSVSTFGRVPNPIRQNDSLIPFVTGNDTSKLMIHINSSYYIHVENSSAPSYIMRLKGNFSNSSCCGIESIANIEELNIQGLTNYTTLRRSSVDYILFASNNISINLTDYDNLSCSFYNVSYSWLKIDSKHLVPNDIYHIKNLAHVPCP
jgi:hypothetical protein